MLKISDKQKKAIRVNEPGNKNINFNELYIMENLKLVFGKYKAISIITLKPSVRKQSFNTLCFLFHTF